MFNVEKKRIIATVIEIAISVVMATLGYKFMGKHYLQRDGGPLGLRSTACLANLIMKLWDIAWTKLMEREGIEWLLYFRYVDDNRTFLAPLSEGWSWTEDGFEFSEEKAELDRNSGISDQSRTTKELVKAMSLLVTFLKFEGEDFEMFHDKTLPTLDTSIWWNGSKVLYNFYEKPMCPNRVLQSDSALSVDCMRSSLTPEVVRRLLHCSSDLLLHVKQEILSKFSQKMLNSGHSTASVKVTFVHGVMKYLEMVRRSKLNVSDPKIQPLHYQKNYKKCERKLSKFLAKSGWYSNENVKSTGMNWRENLPNEWRGSKPVQRKVFGMDYSTVMQVPSSSDGRLLKALASIDPRLAKCSNYQVKLVERSGKPLSWLFSKDFSDGKCSRSDCHVCSNTDLKGPSLCKVPDVVYESVCVLCDEEFKRNPNEHHKGRYIGESYRSMYERTNEH